MEDLVNLYVPTNSPVRNLPTTGIAKIDFLIESWDHITHDQEIGSLQFIVSPDHLIVDKQVFENSEKPIDLSEPQMSKEKSKEKKVKKDKKEKKRDSKEKNKAKKKQDKKGKKHEKEEKEEKVADVREEEIKEEEKAHEEKHDKKDTKEKGGWK